MPIMTYAEYGKIRHPIPYKYKLKTPSGLVYCFGEMHSFDPDHPQWPNQKELFHDFVSKTEGQKRSVFIEGGIKPPQPTEQESILSHGGMGLTTYEARTAGIDTYSPEPDEAYERSELEKTFSRDQIQYYYFARIVSQWGRKEEPKPDFTTYITGYLEGDEKESGWKDYDFSLEAMKVIHQTLFQKDFDENDIDFFYAITHPVSDMCIINKVSAASSVIRDEYIVEQIHKYINDGYSIFVQYGCSHVVMWVPVLKDTYEEIK